MSERFRALVVDDDPIARKTVMFALEQEGFQCDLAPDGEDALRQLGDNQYELVVTDLCMPNKHGHALSLELLEKIPRPVIMVHSGVDDPRLTRDLMTRGVDDIVYKPTNYAAFAAKAKGLVSHRQAGLGNSPSRQPGPNATPMAADKKESREQGKRQSDEDLADPNSDELLIPISDIESKISLVSRILPVSKTALDVFKITRSECDATKLGAAIQRDAALTAEVLSIANSSFYNPSKNPITELDKAVVRIGQQRIGELAMAASTLSALTERKLPWVDVQTIWRQGIAAGVALEHLVAQGKHGKTGDSLVLVAIMHSLGRIVLGMLYPKHYRNLLQQCEQREESLLHWEKSIFPENHSRVMARLLAVWNIPDEICKPMNYIFDTYGSLSRLSEPTRTKVELVKLAVFLGQLSSTAWHLWDLVEIPPASLLKRLQVHDIQRILEQTRTDTQAIMEFQSDAAAGKERGATAQPDTEPGRTIRYENVSTLPFDFVAQLIHGLDIELQGASGESREPAPKIVVNCIGVSKSDPSSALALPDGARVLTISDSNEVPDLGVTQETLQMPVSYGKFHAAVMAARE